MMDINIIKKSTNWADLNDELQKADQSNIHLLYPLLPDLIDHRSWIIRASTLEIIGEGDLKQFVHLVKKAVEDSHPLVQSYAIVYCYSLLKEKGISCVRKQLNSKNVLVRVTAETVYYVATWDTSYLKKIRKIITRRNCNPSNYYAVLRALNLLLIIKQHPELVELLKDIQNVAPKNYAIHREIDELIK